MRRRKRQRYVPSKPKMEHLSVAPLAKNKIKKKVENTKERKGTSYQRFCG